MMKRLILFTNSFPYGKGENWIYDELKVLQNYFSITIVPFTYGGNHNNRWVLPERIQLEPPLFEDSSSFVPLTFPDIFLFFRRNIFARSMEALHNKIFLKRSKILQYLYHIKLEEKLRMHPYFQQLINCMHDTGFYFYWGLGSAQVIPALPASPCNRLFVRMHGYDLYDYRNYGYIPFRKKVMEKVTLVLPVSENGRNYLAERFPGSKDKIHVARLGTISAGISRPSAGKGFTIFSCSALIPLKRVHLIAEALQQTTDIEIKWIHLGDGPEKERIEQICASFPGNISYELKGYLLPGEIPLQYIDNEADLFLHVSETEGVPVAIMEALAASIPVLATNVGGTAEIVDDTVGALMDPVITASELKQRILSFYQLPQQKKEEYRKGALERYNKMCNAVHNAHHLADLISKEMNKQQS